MGDKIHDDRFHCNSNSCMGASGSRDYRPWLKSTLASLLTKRTNLWWFSLLWFSPTQTALDSSKFPMPLCRFHTPVVRCNLLSSLIFEVTRPVQRISHPQYPLDIFVEKVKLGYNSPHIRIRPSPKIEIHIHGSKLIISRRVAMCHAHKATW